MKRYFPLLSPPEALRYAISVEERNTQIYDRLGEMFSRFCPDSPKIVSAFCDLANREKQHATKLNSRYRERFGALSVNVSEDDVQDPIEVPQLSVGDILEFAQKGDAVSAQRGAFEMALAAEQEALDFYAHLVKNTTDPELKALYQELLTLEQEHTGWVEQAIRQVDHS